MTFYLAVIYLVSLALAYTLAFTGATLAIGQSLSNAGTPRGYQDAITPPRFSSLALLVYAVSLVGLGYGFWAFGGLAGLGIAVGFLVATSVNKALLLPKSDSQHFRKLIIHSMMNRHADYLRAGDSLRASVMGELLEKLGVPVYAFVAEMKNGLTSPGTQTPISATPSEAALLEAQDLVNKYGAVLEHSKTLTRSEVALPATKDQIKDALVALARRAKKSGDSLETLDLLRGGYASLASFVSERDAESANSLDNLTAAAAAQLDNVRLGELAAKITASGGALDVVQRSTDEFLRLTAEFDERVRE